MALLGQSAFLKALGWALLNSVWQMGLLWMIFLLLTACMRKLTAQMKHSLAVMMLGAGFCWFAFTLASQYLNYSENPVVLTLSNPDTSPQNLMDIFGSFSKALEGSLPYFSMVYLGITIFLFFRFAAQYRYTNFLCNQNVHKPNVAVRVYVQQIAERLGIRKPIRVWLSEIVDTPMTIGYLKPVILMPIASVNGLSIQQVEAILLHELSHIRRNDYLVNLLIASIDIILFFNPFSRLFVRCIKTEREHSCDDLVMQFEYNAHTYASALLTIEQKRVMKLSLAMAATGRNNQLLLDRVKRILKHPVSDQYTNRLVPLLFSAVMMGFIAWSNPGNVIVRQLLKIEQAAPDLVSTRSEIGEIAVVLSPAKKQKISKKYKAATISQDARTNLRVQPDVLSPLSQYELNTQNNNAYAPTIIQASGSEHVRDFSIAEPGVIASGDNELNNTPFVPSSSFSYYLVQDSTKPTKELESVEEKSARESMHKALKALDEIDWNSIEKGLKASGEKIDIKKVREELKKLLKQVDWQKVDIEGKLEALKEQTKVNELKFYNDLKKIVQSENGQMPEHFQNMQKKIIDDQLKCQQDVQKKELELKRYLREKRIKVRKIVEI